MKTLSDPAAHQVDFVPVDRRVTNLRLLNGPVMHEDSPRFGGVKRQTIRARAQVVEAKVEEDSDIHLVIAPRTHRARTMIVEFPAPQCVASPFKPPEMRAARRVLLSRCPAIGSSDFTIRHGSVTITGVGFWDILHGQTGVAPNGIELHPVLSFTGTCIGRSIGSANLGSMPKANERISKSLPKGLGSIEEHSEEIRAAREGSACR